MRFVKIINLLLCGLLIISGCGSDTPEENEAVLAPTEEKRIPNYFPDAIGNRWVYQHSDGTQWEREVTREHILQGRIYRVFDYTPPIEDTEFDYLRVPSYRVTPNRVLFFVGDEINRYFETELTADLQAIFAEDNTEIQVDAISAHELVLFRIPPTRTVTWDVLDLKIKGDIFFPDVGRGIPFEILFLIEGAIVGGGSVKTPAGHFKTTSKIEYNLEITTKVWEEKETTTQETDTIWLAPDVGVIKTENENGTTELIEYSLQEDPDEQ